ncbi:MAG: pyridoxal phosphate-dependent aminotransferase [Candidatus Scalindua rubra]|uniref:Aminotransferase n=1 Tax=Candidatus Scalindua brodae TaxID=237368 RepID=A0A0B0ELQ9_9BACT|nr:MAG: aspartate aminotransferase AspC [Candidatus Scalindua brodae]MBZ0107773.1 pyridoxal phosphate-dependent aminotransferase [Candidatus Scalindua rubra]
MTTSDIVNKIKPSATLTLNSKVAQLKSDGVSVIGFSAGEPDFDTQEEIKISAIEALKSGFTKYTPTSGIPELKKAISEKLLKENNVSYSPQQVLVSCGAKQVIYNCILALCNDGDEVLIPAPYWVSYPEQVTLARGKSVFIESSDENDFKITKDDIERNITDKTKILIINSPNNPTGSLYTEKELYEIVQFAINAGLYIISDEIYEKIIYDGEKHISPASFGKEFFEKLITVNGFSKTFSMTGWRIGYAAGPIDVIKAATLIQDHTTSGANSITQKAAVTALQGNEKTITNMVKEFDKRRKYIVDRLNNIDGITCMLPKGAFYVFPNISSLYNRDICGQKVTNSVDLANLVLDKAKIAFVPGTCFGSDAHLRISYATSIENIEEGMNRLEKLLNEGIEHKG